MAIATVLAAAPAAQGAGVMSTWSIRRRWRLANSTWGLPIPFGSRRESLTCTTSSRTRTGRVGTRPVTALPLRAISPGRRWQKWDCALLGPAYHVLNDAIDTTPGGAQLWFDPGLGSDKAFLGALGLLASRSDHAELSAVPWVLWGHSEAGSGPK